MYEPAEDTWLLSDAVCGDAVRWERGTSLMLELGSGSGGVCTSVLLFLRDRLHSRPGIDLGGHISAPPMFCLACDLNPHACRVTASTGLENGVSAHLDVVQCDLLSSMVERLTGSVDLFLFNPPYVPTPAEEVPKPSAFAAEGEEGALLDSLPAAWAGGENGRQVIDRALPLLPRLLRKPNVSLEGDAGGVAYWLLLRENDPKGVIRAVEGMGLQGTVIARRTAANEKLCVARIQWKLGVE